MFRTRKNAFIICFVMIGIVLTIAVSVLLACYKNNNEKPETWDVDQEEAEITEAEATEPKTAEVKAYRVPGIDPEGEEKKEPTPVQEPVKEKITPVLSEEEILNMTDDEFMKYGQLVFDGLLNDAYPTFFQLAEVKDILEKNNGSFIRLAERLGSAENSSDAWYIAEEFWSQINRNLKKSRVENAGIVYENDDYWLLKGEYYSDHVLLQNELMIILKSDYYDFDTKKAGFELNEENIKRFFDLICELHHNRWCICIGEYVSRVEDDFEFRRYYIDVQDQIDFDEWDNMLLKKTWHISDDGIVELSKFESAVLKQWNSEKWLLWQMYGEDEEL